MIVLVIGNAGTGKTHFVNNSLNLITNEIPTIIHSVGRDDVPTLLAREDLCVIEALGDVDIPIELRKASTHIVFTSICAFERYFCRRANEPCPLPPIQVIKAINALNSPHGFVIYDHKSLVSYTNYIIYI